MASKIMLASTCVALLALLLGLLTFDFSTVNALWLVDSQSDDQTPLSTSRSLNGSRSVSQDWDILYHQGGNSPWIPKINGTISTDTSPPPGCRVEQVHMMSRHAERYPTYLAGINMLELYQRIQHANVTLRGDLEFVNEWDFFMRDPGGRLENLVATGPCAGTLRAFTTGVELRTKYEDLVEQALESGQTNFWASGSNRVEETAKYFAAGLFGLDWQEKAQLLVVPETEDRGGDTLTPDKSCFKYLHNADDHGRAYGYRMWNAWREVYLPPIATRLAQENPAINFTASEIYSMQELCGFETIAKGESKWCDVFSHEEWEQFEYARDLLHYYRTGPGNPYSATMGWLWLNATANLLQAGPEAGPLFFSFVHDGDILPMLSALDFFPQSTIHLPTDRIPHLRTWRTSDIVPMSGRIVFERLFCNLQQQCWDHADYGYPNHRFCEPAQQGVFVRLNVNDGIVAIPGCESGPGSSCPLDDFLARVKKRGEEVGDFRAVCGLPRTAKGGIEFLHQ